MVPQHLLLRRASASLTLCRRSSGWLGGILGRTKGPSPQLAESEQSEERKDNVQLPPEEALEKIARDHLPQISDADSSWREASLGNPHLKAKILACFEETFQHPIPDQKLASISTFTDLANMLETPDSQPASRVFPNIKDDGSLPPNLSIQFINTAPKPKPNRKPFQNYDARRPEHANFLTKAQRERRKLKGRYLTATRYKP